ncbi:hypothetical protein GGI07_004980 [Coemansia sp. Benny D115]|nr:hypothetical protein GGI07_004980 [Coemansia sp. Benny D115]
MPSIFSRKSKSGSRNQERPPSILPADFTHSRGGLSHLRRNEAPEAAMPVRPPAPVLKDLPNPPPEAAANGQFAPGYGGNQVPPPQQQPQTQLQQSASMPDARQYPASQIPAAAPNSTGSIPNIVTNGSANTNGNGYPNNQQRPMAPQGQHPGSAQGPQHGNPLQNGSQVAAAQRTGEQPARSSSEQQGRSASSFWSKRQLSGASMFPRRGFSSALHDTLVYWFGGKSDGELHEDLFIMDSASWEVRAVEAVGNVPHAREGHSAAFIGRTMFVFGGQNAQGRYDENLYAFNMGNHTWYKVPMKGPPLAGRKGHSTAPVGSKLYVFGGTSDGYFFNDLVSFDVRAAAKSGPHWDFTSPLPANPQQAPAPRAGHSCSVYPNSIFIFGGMNSERCFNDLWEYSLDNHTWTLVTPNGATPPARYGHASAVVDDCIVIMGGRTLRGEPLNDFFAYKITSQRWYTFQVNSSTWPHQIDPVFSLVKTRLLLYSGSMPRDEVETTVYSLDTSKIKIQPDAPRSTPPQQQQQQIRSPQQPPQQQPPPLAESEDDAADRSRRHRSLMPPPHQQQQQQQSMQRNPLDQMPQNGQPAARAVSMVGGAAAERAIREQHAPLGQVPGNRPSESGIPFPPTSSANQTNGRPQPPAPLDTRSPQPAPAQNNTSMESFDIVSPLEDGENARTSGTSGAWAAQGTKGRAHQRRSIVLNQSLVNSNASGSPPVGPLVNGAGSNTSLGALSHESLGGMVHQPMPQQQQQQQQNQQQLSMQGPQRDDRRLTIQLRNRNSVAALSSSGDLPDASEFHGDSLALAVPPPPAATAAAAPQDKEAGQAPADVSERLPALRRNSTQMSISSEHKDAVFRAWSLLEIKYAHQRSARADPGHDDVSASVQSMQTQNEDLLSEEATKVLGVLLAMRRELAETKQQLSTVSRVAMERVAEAERGRKAALQEAIYLKAKASALTAGNAPLLGKLNTHRIHELERLYANTLNDNDALRNQLAQANLALKQSHDMLSEFKNDAELTRRQLRELELLQAEEQPRSLDLERRLAEKEALLAQQAQADAERAERLEATRQQAQAAQERAERVQAMHAEAMARADALSSANVELQAEVDRQKMLATRSRERAADFERLWTESRDELASFRDLRASVEQLEAKERRIADLEQQLADQSHGRQRQDSGAAQQVPRASFSSDSSTTDTRVRELHAAYLAAHRQWSEARDELLVLKNALREANDQRQDSESRLSARDRELNDMQARLAAFTALLQEYAERQQLRPRAADRKDDDSISVQSMLAAIQQLQRSSSIATASRPSIDAVKPAVAAASASVAVPRVLEA